MTQPEYEQKKRECWEDFCRKFLPEADSETTMKDVIDFAFDRAYSLGKLHTSCRQVKETISQEEIECAAEVFAYKIKIPASLPGALVPFINGLAHDSYLQGALDFIGKQEKDAEETVICGWVARDDGERWHERELHLFTRNKPERRKLMGDWIGRPSMTLDSNLFHDLTWKSDPIEVEIIIKRKKK